MLAQNTSWHTRAMRLQAYKVKVHWLKTVHNQANYAQSIASQRKKLLFLANINVSLDVLTLVLLSNSQLRIRLRSIFIISSTFSCVFARLDWCSKFPYRKSQFENHSYSPCWHGYGYVPTASLNVMTVFVYYLFIIFGYVPTALC